MPPILIRFGRGPKPRIHIRWLRAAWNGIRRVCPVDTGRMLRSIRMNRTRRTIRIGVHYASHVNQRGRSAGFVYRGINRSKMASRYQYTVNPP